MDVEENLMSLGTYRLEHRQPRQDPAALADPSPKRWQAAFSYVCAIGWSGDHGTDGRVPAMALPFVHGTTATARLLVTYRLWEESADGVGDRELRRTAGARCRLSPQA
jgi:hypothetical protein